MHRLRMLLTTALAAAGAACLLSAANPATSPATVRHTISAGESLSLICIRAYGCYDTAMNAEILRLNTGLSSVNRITAGSVLVLPAPQSATKTAPAAAIPLFERREAVRQAVVTFVEGDASAVCGSGPKKALSANTILAPGDIIITGPGGRAEIVVNRESVVRVRENTRLVFTQARDQAKNSVPTKFDLAGGTLWTTVKRMSAAVNRFELTLPTAVAGVHGTVYQTSVSGDSSSLVKVFDGAVAVKNKPLNADEGDGSTEVAGPEEIAGPSEVSLEEWVQIVRSMQQIRVSKKGSPGKPEAFAKTPTDAWEQWNAERDRAAFELFGETSR